MVSNGVSTLLLVAFVQVACSSYIHPQPSHVRYEEGCCPGQVIEKKHVIHKPVTQTYTYQEPVYSRKCHQKSAGVDKQVIPRSYETSPVCQTQETVVKIPTTDVEIQSQPLCKRTCTTSRYMIQIPITETTCTNSPLCKQTVRSQDNLLTTVSKKTSCAKQHCTQNTVVEKPVFETVCQDYQQSVNKVGTKTVLKPEIKKSCVQLPPYRCMKPVYDSAPAFSSDSSHFGYSTPAEYSAGSAHFGYSTPAEYSAGSAHFAPSTSYDVSGAVYDNSYASAGTCEVPVAAGSSSYDFSSGPFYGSVPASVSGPAYYSQPSHAPCSCA